MTEKEYALTNAQEILSQETAKLTLLRQLAEIDNAAVLARVAKAQARVEVVKLSAEACLLQTKSQVIQQEAAVRSARAWVTRCKQDEKEF